MEVATLVGGSLSATFDLLLKKLNGYLSAQLRKSKKELHAQMENWKNLLPTIIVVIEDLEKEHYTQQSVKLWLVDLRDLAYDMEDILEEFVIDAKRFKLKAKYKASIKGITKRLQEIENKMNASGLINSTMKVEDKCRGVATERQLESIHLEDEVWGRQRDKYAILSMLLQAEYSSEENFVIPIFGMCGVGKTTLARLICDDETVKCHFYWTVWVCVSNEFDVIRITRNILQQLVGKGYDVEDLVFLQENLKQELYGRRFLLVLDDVWNESYELWDILRRPLLSGAHGSKIIVTTQNRCVGEMMGGYNGGYHLKLLEYDACFSLFTKHALGVENFDAHPNLRDVGEELIKRCKGLPLALKFLSGLLRGNLHPSHWENILNSEIFHLSKDRSGSLLSTLRRSYIYLPSHLKQCFAYCALFSKGYEFHEAELVLLWIAEGLILSNRKEQMEDIGHLYFRGLLSRSLLQQSDEDGSLFVMHDLIHDLALYVSGEIYCKLERIMDDEMLEVTPEKARHLSFFPCPYENPKRFTVLDKLKNLRTFLQLKPSGDCFKNYLSNRVMYDFLPRLERLRVLSLCNYRIRQLPDSIKNLQHLRYIDLSATEIECVPESIGSLLFLHTLLLCDCEMLSKLPATIGNLVDLHHLDITHTPSLIEMPSAIANLTNLLTLSKFIVGKEKRLMRLTNLKNLSQLRGELSILDLQNVLDVRDAIEASLDKIDGLEKLLLEWTSHFDNSKNDSEGTSILNWLKPHPKLKSLTISYYGGEEFPSWLGDSLFSNLSYLELRCCKRCTLLPSVGLLPTLKELLIEGMGALEAVGPELNGHGTFSSLETLVFRDMLNWKEWTCLSGSGGEFPCLRKLVIKNCPRLIGQLPSHLSFLENLVIDECPQLKCSSISLSSLKELDIGACNVVLLTSMVDLTCLTNLRIRRIRDLTCLPNSFVQPLTALENLQIVECYKLTYLWEEGAEIVNLAHLKKIEIESCPLLVSLTEKEQGLLPFNLKHLSLSKCKLSESLPDVMMMKMDGSSSSNMLRLEVLKITGCPSLKSFSGGKLPTMLKQLVIEDCENLVSLPDGVLMQNDGDNSSNLEVLLIRKLPCLNSFQSGQLPASLKKFDVSDCKRLESFPESMLQQCTGLQCITIWGCDMLKSLSSLNCLSNLVELDIINCKALKSIDLSSANSSLKSLRIYACKNLNFFPNTMYQLTSLQSIEIEGCPGIQFIPDGGLPPNLTDLELDSGSLKSLVLPPDIPLKKLTICQTCPLDTVLPPSLTFLWIWNDKNLESIPSRLLQNLNSLQHLRLSNCQRLRSLPWELPPSLGELIIEECPLLKRKRFEVHGDYRSLTHTIPCIKIDMEQVLFFG